MIDRTLISRGRTDNVIECIMTCDGCEKKYKPLEYDEKGACSVLLIPEGNAKFEKIEYSEICDSCRVKIMEFINSLTPEI